MEEKIRTRIEELKKELEKFVNDANVRITAYNAIIAELESLLKQAS